MCALLCPWICFYSPTLGEVGPVSHNHSAEHDVVPGEVAGEQVSWAHHGDAKHIRHLISVR